MKKRIVSVISMLAVVMTMLFGQVISVAAEEQSSAMVDGSYLTMEDSSEGFIEENPLLRGEHLMDGNSGISKAGRGRLYAYGATTADHEVDFIAVIVYVDQYDEELDDWLQVATWTVEDENTTYISTGKIVEVERGHFYRVHCEHFAGNNDEPRYDHDASFTDGILIS